MNTETQQALIQSWEHWWRLSTSETWEDVYREGIGTADCALCSLFYRRFLRDGVFSVTGCDGCPVYEKTGMAGCNGTPYDDASEAWDTLWNTWGACDESVSDPDPRPAMDDFRAAARRELKFLAELMPDGPGR